MGEHGDALQLELREGSKNDINIKSVDHIHFKMHPSLSIHFGNLNDKIKIS